MLKKIVILPALFFLVHAAYIGCCKCANINGGQYTKAQFLGLTLFDTRANTGVQPNGTTTADTLLLNPMFTYDCVAANKNPFAGFVNSAYAFSCKCSGCGINGLKSKVTALEITSDSAYNSYLPGQNLAPLFKVRSYYSSSTNLISIDSAIKQFNLLGPGALSGYQFLINTKPSGPKGHLFAMKYIFADGSNIQSSTGRFFWY